MKITEHFTFNELVRTTHIELQQQNAADALGYMKQLKYIASTLEEIRAILNVPVKVTSGFRNNTLNKLVGGSPTSGHTKGLCADIQPIDMSIEDAFELIQFNKDKCPSLKKCIKEKVGGSEWLHIETKTERFQPTKFYTTNNGKTYTEVA